MIDLTPPQEIKRQKTQYVVGTSTRLAIAFFVIVIGWGGYSLYKATFLKGQISAMEVRESELVAQRSSMSETESYAKKISGKYFLLQKYLESRFRYSSIMQELVSRVPNGVSLDSIAFEGMDKRAKVSGTSADVVQVSSFVSYLSKEGNASSQSAASLSDKNAFTDIRLDSLSVNEGKPVDFSVSFQTNSEVFSK